MKILVTGASGFIASQIICDLLGDGQEVICCARNIPYTQNLFPEAKILPCDFIKDIHTSDWLPRLKGIDVVINCVGVFYHPQKQVVWNIHYETPKALFDACVEAGVKKIIQISALGIDTSDVLYSTSKKAAEDYLQTLDIPSIIIRPSFVYAKGSYGGSALFRGLAGLPFITPLPGGGKQEFQPIHLNDLAKGVVALVKKPANESLVLHAVSEKKVSLRTILTQMRAWLGFKKATLLPVPLPFIRLASFIGDWIPYSAMNSGSYKLMQQNNVTTPEDTARFAEEIGFTPKNYPQGLYTEPSTVEDHWHARLFFLKIPLRLSIAFVWIWTALSCLFFLPANEFNALLVQTGLSPSWYSFTLIGSALLDGILGLALAFNWQTRKIIPLQIAVMLIYTAFISLKLPYLWLDPFAAIAKNIPLILASLVYLAMESDR